MKKLTLFILLVGFFAGILLVLSLRALWVKKSTDVSFIPQKVTITIVPPSHAYSGVISSLLGDVKQQRRDSDDFANVASGAAFIEGETLETTTGVASVTFLNISKITLNPNSQVAFIDGLPSEFLFQQTSGKVMYEMLDDTKTLSVRSLHMLLQVSGKATVTTDPDTGSILVEMQFGNGKIGINDTNDNTNVYQLAQGQKAVIDDTTRSVEIE